MNWTAFSMALLGHLLFQTNVLSQESTTLGIHTFSYHNSGNYNDTTPGLYLERNHFVVGAYHNSIRNTSVYALCDWRLPQQHSKYICVCGLHMGLGFTTQPRLPSHLIHRGVGNGLQTQRLQPRSVSAGRNKSEA